MALELLKKKNYLAMIENSAKGESWTFRNLFFKIDGKVIDVLEDGGLSCAFFVSAVLYLSKLIADLHTTVVGTEKDIMESGWTETEDLKEGVILVWEKKMGKTDGVGHFHIGFYLGDQMAVSNDSRGSGFPHKHHFTYDDTRKIEKIYWHPALDKS
jgi:hypothetical protein